uniref:DNA polymerase III subunit epsilon n=1 Tax=Pararhizobium sp. IMCC3301 TaxID=3067904 RepID=UPI002742250D|nr:DNA polymerase III subunit epsilon [Pararhizobium sp. IMCC3301]
MREIVFDTETTGLDARKGDKLIEIGCVELVNRFPTGKTYHQYINPEREVSPGAFDVHGLSWDSLKDKPVFADIAAGFMEFVGEDGILVAHNASFDMGFVNTELAAIGQSAYPDERVVDTLVLARRKNPAGPNSLDALCTRFGVNNNHRTFHGALLDAELLAKVYLELLGGAQADLGLNAANPEEGLDEDGNLWHPKPRPDPLPPRLSDDERAAHAVYVATFAVESLWSIYQPRTRRTPRTGRT